LVVDGISKLVEFISKKKEQKKNKKES